MQKNPLESTKLYGLENYFNQITDLYNKNVMPNKILFSGRKGQGKSTLAYHIINYIFSADEDLKYDVDNFVINSKNRSYKLIQNYSHPNFYLIDILDEKKNIDISQIREMIKYSNKSSFNNQPRIILINNVEHLNKNSVNALLKIVEEPNENIFFLLVHDSSKKILSTLKSRCIVFNINLSFDQSINISNFLLNENILNLINHDLISYYNTPGEVINLVNFAHEKKIDLKKNSLIDILDLLINNGYYKKNRIIKELLINFIELFFLKEYKYSKAKYSLLNSYHAFINKVNHTEKFNLDEETLFLEFKSKLLNG